MTTIFISDLHLRQDDPVITENFLGLLQSNPFGANTLYILGDFFEMWIGDDDLTPFHLEIIQALRKFKDSGKTIFLMCGNRDFLLGKDFAERSGCTLLKDPTVIDLFGEPTLLTHGDLLCIDDKAHQRFRKISQHPFTKKIFTSFPILFRRHLAKTIHQKSQNKMRALNSTTMDISWHALLTLIREYKVKQIIHGHTHKPMIQYFVLNSLNKSTDNNFAKHFVLSDWHQQGNALICNGDGKKELVYFKLKSRCGNETPYLSKRLTLPQS